MPRAKRRSAESDGNAAPASASTAPSRAKRSKDATQKNNTSGNASIALEAPKKAGANLSKVSEKVKDDTSADAQPLTATASNVNAAEKEKEKDNVSGSATEGKKQTPREKHEAENAAQEKAILAKMASPEGLEYRCMSRPWKDRKAEWRDDEDMDEEPDEEDMEQCIEENKKYSEATPEEVPEWPWVVTKMGNYLVNEYTDQAQRRDQDNFDMYVYNDFTGYGLQEVVENQLVAFHEEYTKKDSDPHRVFVHMEAMAIWLFINELAPWVGLDDGDRLCATVDAIGRALLTALNALERADLLKPDSKVKNLPMVLSMFLSLASDLDGTGAMERDMLGADKDQTWPHAVVAYARAHDIDLKGKGIYGSAETVDKFDDMGMEDFKKKAGPDRWGFKTAFKAFTAHWAAPSGPKKKTLGGEFFDIIKKSSAYRKKHAFDGKDPLDKMDPDRLVH
ncbi:uncharacterized protein BDZ99DRAFT_460703 [Mytilinidion resinicola]|uniref:Uncharacterized protein n=1 Tax=Mytilinidion resinicola TaxID=574789 RepID=A0A6A6YZM6_9PEZI|nr:uncharacterized protein BDZ99DRAFT_460703 [Mytilinidion resinicola]KAF2813464.1 hypothetical protein BDZ99DRAFT_460703 [Mytilinidion resinicola]